MTAPRKPIKCRLCGHTGRGVVASLVPGEGLCQSARGCEKRQKEAARQRNFGGWGTSPKWSRRIDRGAKV